MLMNGLLKVTYALSGTAILNEEWTENGVQHLLTDNQYEIKWCVI